MYSSKSGSLYMQLYLWLFEWSLSGYLKVFNLILWFFICVFYIWLLKCVDNCLVLYTYIFISGYLIVSFSGEGLWISVFCCTTNSSASFSDYFTKSYLFISACRIINAFLIIYLYRLLLSVSLFLYLYIFLYVTFNIFFFVFFI